MARLPTFFASTPLSLGLFALLGLKCAVNAQGIADLPTCASNCANTAAIAIGCSLTDAACLCRTQTFATATIQCTTKVCSIEDQSLTIGLLDKMCNSASTSSSSSTVGSSSSSSQSKPTASPPATSSGSPTSTTRSTNPNPTTPTPSTPTLPTFSITITTEASDLTLLSSSGSTTLSISPPNSTFVVVSTVTAAVSPTTNAATALRQNAGERLALIGTMVAGLFALL
ncbi:hypothetical protein D9615_009854 [Tricholomella constricta]|uniref:CFEM domain-containing protein n=1 Tax=Tricholomella constricta TaxID=117010 RepID=A0A8H5LX10_9AGAR|nr:hypothetical protein D9615_009854 [Tricholomella constricta]